MQLRVNARAPELGSTRAEIELSCSQQEGSLSITAGSNGAIVVVCQLGAQPLFSGMEFEGRLMGSTVLLERADFAAIRRELESRYGAARREDRHAARDRIDLLGLIELQDFLLLALLIGGVTLLHLLHLRL